MSMLWCYLCSHIIPAFCDFPLMYEQVQLMEPAVKGTLNVLNACSEAKVKRVVFVSSVAAIFMNPNWPAGQVKDENCWSDKEYCKRTNVCKFQFLSFIAVLYVESNPLRSTQSLFFTCGHWVVCHDFNQLLYIISHRLSILCIHWNAEHTNYCSCRTGTVLPKQKLKWKLLNMPEEVASMSYQFVQPLLWVLWCSQASMQVAWCLSIFWKVIYLSLLTDFCNALAIFVFMSAFF